MTEKQGVVRTALTGAGRSPRTPTPGESLWGRRFAAIAATLAVVGAIVGGSASAVFLVAAMGFLLLFGYCFRHTTYGASTGAF